MAAKSETRSKPFEEILRTILESEVTDSNIVKTVVRKLFVKSVAERDYSAQEVFHILMCFLMVHSSREFVPVTVRKDSWVHLRSNEEQARGRSILTKYECRLLDQAVV